MEEAFSRADLVAAALEQSTGLPVHERSFFLLRLGTDYFDYDFPWEPFRDLAGPLRGFENAMPIVIVSSPQGERTDRPLVTRSRYPSDYIRIDVSPLCSAKDVANTWLECLVDANASAQGPAVWFPDVIGVKDSEFTAKAFGFLQLPSD